MDQLIAGIILGPSVFGALLPDLQHRCRRPFRYRTLFTRASPAKLGAGIIVSAARRAH
jgi:hypothetical protein